MVERELIENSLNLQKLTIKLVESNNLLIRKIDNMISLFEDAAKNVSSGDTEEIFNLNKRINELVEQNKQLARGLVLMEDKLKNSPRLQPRPLPKL